MLKRIHGREFFPYRLPDGTWAFSTIIDRTEADHLPHRFHTLLACLHYRCRNRAE